MEAVEIISMSLILNLKEPIFLHCQKISNKSTFSVELVEEIKKILTVFFIKARKNFLCSRFNCKKKEK